MAKLALYEDSEGKEYVVLLTSRQYEQDLDDDGMMLTQEINIPNDLTPFPTDRMLVDELYT